MSIHTTTPPTADETGPETEQPAPQASRFDERGIALQTIIIMVVLLAIAGSVAVVLANRAGTETGRMENQDTTHFTRITNYNACTLAGGRPSEKAYTVGGTFADPVTDSNRADYGGCWPPA